MRDVDSRSACTVAVSLPRSSVGLAAASLMCTWITAAPASWHSFAVVAGSSRVTGRAGTSFFADSAPVGGRVVGSIAEPGLVVLLGVTHSDTATVADALARKIFELRILDGEKSCADTGAPLLVISQFTLYADTRKGRRPSWSAAAAGPVAAPLVDSFVASLRSRGARVETGVFGAM